ncbi:CMRF35-like molecule 5 isoform X3 [Salmo salar]|uniref:CMRF35-like molecule 5 isoform X3 n=1 Tax=Salmo salar TaxID=8030 RepID=A0A1S3N6F8_SALSA|nr:CMRF35-like molecule 5 isoform X3 [Salmo salar]|eukprot:XP_014010641.1 PREDICTED: CMRF35-like molecule 5 isoform X3 [Salmo salar]
MANHLSFLLLFLIFYRVSAVSHVSVQTGGSITIPCSYDQYYINHVKYWCKGYGWTICSSVVRTDHPKSTDRASISDDIAQKVFTVIMTDLEPEDSNTYRCVVEINGGTDSMIQLFYLSVTPATQDPTTQQPSASPTAEPVQNDNTSQGAEGNMEEVHQRSVKVLLISLGMLVVVTAGILVTWKMWRKHKDNKAKDQTTNNSVSADPEKDITYSTVTHTRETASQDLFPEADDDVTYSTVILQHKAQLKGQTKSAEPDDNVVYSSLALQVTTHSRGQQHSSD